MKNFVIWMTGLPGAGKTTIADGVASRLSLGVIDGNRFRASQTVQLGFSQEDRLKNVTAAAHQAVRVANAGTGCIAAFITPLESHREAVKKIIVDGGCEFKLVHITCDISDCMKRKPLLYQDAFAGKIKEFTGVSSDYEPPQGSDLVLTNSTGMHNDCINALCEQIESWFYH